MCHIAEVQWQNHQSDFNLICQVLRYQFSWCVLPNMAIKPKSIQCAGRAECRAVIWLCNESGIVSSQTLGTVSSGSSLYTNRETERDPLGSLCGFHERAWKPFGALRTCSSCWCRSHHSKTCLMNTIITLDVRAASSWRRSVKKQAIVPFSQHIKVILENKSPFFCSYSSVRSHMSALAMLHSVRHDPSIVTLCVTEHITHVHKHVIPRWGRRLNFAGAEI